MGFTIITEYSAWLIIPCLILAAGYSFVLYRKDIKFKEVSKLKKIIMASLRFVAVFFIAILLLSPLVRSIINHIERPVIIIAQDNSQSVVINKDSTYYRSNYPAEIEKLIKELSGEYEIATYSFGEKVVKGFDFSYSHRLSDFSELFDEITNNYTNRNVGALIIASDGIFNKGVNPIYAGNDINFPVYGIALGDTAIQKDISLSQVKSNRIAFLGNIFPIQINVEVKELAGIETLLKVTHKGKELFKKQIKATGNSYYETVDIEVEAKETGIQHYMVEITPNEQEVSTRNNYKDVVIDVIDSKQKVLILANAPHPDIAAIRSTLELNQNIEVDFSTIENFTKITELPKYNLLILHQLPSKTNTANAVLSAITKGDMPVLFILGTQSAFNNVSNLNLGLSVIQRKSAFDEVQPVINEQFPYFEINDAIKQYLRNVPPLVAPFGDYKASASANVLFYQKIKNINTPTPLVVFDNQSGRKTAFIAGEGIWRWRMYDYLENQNHEQFNELFNKIVQYLALQVSKSNFVVNAKRIYAENEAVTFTAEVYNESFELITDADVSIEIATSEDKKFSFVLSADKAVTKTYNLNIGMMPVGDYTYTAIAKIGDKEYKQTGNFTVEEMNQEAERTVANHQILYQLAQQHGGSIFYPANLNQLPQEIEKNKNIVQVSYSEKHLQDAISMKWLFFFILLLLSVEWFLRKYLGGY